MNGKNIFFLYFVKFLVIYQPAGYDVQCLQLYDCNKALGMESGQIRDDQLSSSSTHNENSVGARNGRIRVERQGGAWCPQNVITADSREYLQIDLLERMIVTASESQGRFGNGRGVEWTETYSLHYYRHDVFINSGSVSNNKQFISANHNTAANVFPTKANDEEKKWHMYRNVSGHYLMHGNVDTYMTSMMALNPPIFASKIRFLPYSLHPRTVCMRVELYGCKLSDSFYSYSLSVPNAQWFDTTYDGKRLNDVMVHGLGQLYDGQLASDRTDDSAWVGWNRKERSIVMLIFSFHKPTIFNMLTIHCSNKFSQQIRIFTVAKVSFSMDSVKYGQEYIQRIQPDDIVEAARFINIPLNAEIGRHIKIQLEYNSLNLLISEVTFELNQIKTVELDVLLNQHMLSNKTVKFPAMKTNFTKSQNNFSYRPHSVLIIISISFAILLMLFLLAIYILQMSKRRRVSESVFSRYKTSPKNLPISFMYSHSRKSDCLQHGRALVPDSAWMMKDNYIKDVGCLEHGINDEEKMCLVEDINKIGCINSNRMDVSCCDSNQENFYEYAEPIMNCNREDNITNDMRRRCSVYNVSCLIHDRRVASINRSESLGLRESTTSTSLPSTGSSTATCDNHIIPANGMHLSTSKFNHSDLMNPATPINFTYSNQTDAKNRLSKTKRSHNRNLRKICAENSVSRMGTSLWRQLKTNCSAQTDSHKQIASIDGHSVLLFEQIYKGIYSEIFTCRIRLSFGEYKTMKEKNSINIKHLQPTATVRFLANKLTPPEVIKEIDQLVALLAITQHENVVRLLGVSSNVEQSYVVVEHGELGNLHTFLRTFSLPSSVCSTCALPSDRSLLQLFEHVSKTENLTEIVHQIAKGVDHLATLGIIHGDLAARNCVVTSNLLIKICDMGPAYETQFTSDYVNVNSTRLLPLRWMAPESLLTNTCDPSHDIWSFGILMWEVYSRCLARPFNHLNDMQVLDTFISLCEDGLDSHAEDESSECISRLLAQPVYCPIEKYALIQQCCSLVNDRHVRPSPNYILSCFDVS